MTDSFNEATPFTVHDSNLRQRFFIQNSPMRGDVVRLQKSYASITAQKDYPEAIKRLLGEMLVSASLLIGTLKIKGTLSIQLQSNDDSSLLNWAMAECDHDGVIRALASWQDNEEHAQTYWASKRTADDAFIQLGEVGKGVLFINIRPTQGEGYQGIVERVADNLADCLAHYQQQSAQIPTQIALACDGLQAGGILVQQLPRTLAEERLSENAQNAGEIEGNLDDLWQRITMLTRTIKDEELTTLPANEIIFRLYHEENVVTPSPTHLQFGCTCSRQKCESAILQVGETEAMAIVQEQGQIEMDCGFCGAVYRFEKGAVSDIFA